MCQGAKNGPDQTQCGRSCALQSGQMLRAIDVTLFFCFFHFLYTNLDSNSLHAKFLVHSSSGYVLYDAVK